MKHISKSKHIKRVKYPLVSVVIPVFNGAVYLEETVQSVLKNTYKKIEILLIDDGSKDESKNLCRRLSKKYRKVSFYSFHKNNGLGRILNYALKKAKGEFICRINQDDRMAPKRIETQVRFLLRHPKIVAVGSNIKLFDSKGNKQIIHFPQTDIEIKRLWHMVSPFSDPSVMYRKSIALSVGGYKQEFWPADDTHLWIRMGVVGKLANINKPLVEVRYHDNAASIKYFRKLAQVTYDMHKWMHEFVSPAPWFVRAFWECELLAGLAFSPHINWAVYRFLKRGFFAVHSVVAFLRKVDIKETITMRKVVLQPMTLSRSGQ